MSILKILWKIFLVLLITGIWAAITCWGNLSLDWILVYSFWGWWGSYSWSQYSWWLFILWGIEILAIFFFAIWFVRKWMQDENIMNIFKKSIQILCIIFIISFIFRILADWIISPPGIIYDYNKHLLEERYILIATLWVNTIGWLILWHRLLKDSLQWWKKWWLLIILISISSIGIWLL